MKKKVLKFLRENYIYLIMLVLVAIRLFLGKAIGGWFGASETYDDVAMLRGLDPHRFTNPTNLTLIKDLSFSVFLGLSAISGLPYTVFLSLFWVLTAFVVWILVGKFTKNKWVRLGAFTYVLFLPIAFTSWGGLRIYRNAVIAPTIILTFCLLLIGLVNLVREEKRKKAAWLAIIAGLVFAYAYYLKEDGIWMMACLLVLMAIELTVIAYRLFKGKGAKRARTKSALAWTVICIIPFLVWFGWTNIYKGVNHAFFGVYETNTRTKGELGKFVENIYKIEAEGRTEIIWAPVDALKQAFVASPTLGAHPELFDEIMTTGFQPGGLEVNPIGRDFLTWIMRSELFDAGLWTSEAEVNEMFKQVNAELEEAFRNGTLKKAEGRIQLLASTGGYTWDEITNSDILGQIWASLEDSIWFTRYEIGFGESEIEYGTKRNHTDYTLVNRALHMTDDLNLVEKSGRKEAQEVVKVMMWVYRVVNVVLIVVMVGSYVYAVVMIIKNRKSLKKYVKKERAALCCVAASFIFFGVTLAYSFATAWFFISPAGTAPGITFVFYYVGVPGLLTMALLAAGVGVTNFVKRKSKQEMIREHNYLYRLCFDKDLDLDNPKDFNQKIHWLIINKYGKREGMLADKNSVKEYVRKKHVSGLEIPETLATYTDANQIDINSLPDKFVLKCNHFSGHVFICTDKKTFDLKSAQRQLNEDLEKNFADINKEYYYSYIKPVIIAEEYLNDGSHKNPVDYKIYCFNGKAESILVCSNREVKLKLNDFDLNWNELDYTTSDYRSAEKLTKPKNLKRMVKIAEQLAHDIPFVRVDLYEIGGKIYFGEYTFAPGAGIIRYYKQEALDYLGQKLDFNLYK